MAEDKGHIEYVFGGAGISPTSAFHDQTTCDALYAVLKQHNVTVIDSAQLYQGSERILGETSAGSQFTIDTKTPGQFQPGRVDNLVKEAHDSLGHLQLKQVDVFYVHAPGEHGSTETLLANINQAHQEGVFRRFGLSNFTPRAVEEIYNECKAKGYVVPSVYQGNYNPVARRTEYELFPTLRKLGIAFRAYSPVAGGFLTKTRAQIEGRGADSGRFAEGSRGGFYYDMYARPSLLDALEKWEVIAKEEGCSKAELAFRWVAYNSPLSTKYGDGLILGASKLQQVQETLEGLSHGSLSEGACRKIDEIWESIRHESPLDNFSRN